MRCISERLNTIWITQRGRSRAMEILIAPVEREGELVSKSELMARVWLNTVVEENNLKVHVATLRRTLGDGQPGRHYVATVPGRGYRFVAPAAGSPRRQGGARAQFARRTTTSDRTRMASPLGDKWQ
jgi:DNA-binding winged helix-turn-helix (wHTH) protein